MAAIEGQLKEETTEPMNIVSKDTIEEGKGKEAQIKDKSKEAMSASTEIEPKTGVSFPTKLEDRKQLNAVGLRKKSILGLGLKIYSFGIYADNVKLKELLRLKIGKSLEKPTKEMYELVINSDVGMMVRLVLVFSGLTMSMVRKNFDETLGASLKKLTGGQKNNELVNKVMGAATDNIKLSSGSVIEITRFPGFILQAKVKEEIVSKVESELLCRAYFDMYLGDDPFDKEAKENFGMSLLSLL
ncbi:chalcone isomerase-like protein 1 [Magnolia sinica]|uniref:chalcone isomerase-like protein 1 n=1 Tax=Magnolia sinica TaxID=86752 RepID=UPI002658E538|nr:chalcone isomerase-like protein 1 [Magnolia sinica]